MNGLTTVLVLGVCGYLAYELGLLSPFIGKPCPPGEEWIGGLFAGCALSSSGVVLSLDPLTVGMDS
jgi:hypothetical protein